MTLLEFIVYLVIAGVCGAVARALAGGSSGGFILSILLGFLGAFVGTWVARMFHLPEIILVAIAGHPFPIVWSVIGGMILVMIAHALTRGPRIRYSRY
ncbi:MAG TPA: GlsB/YeaQ/YmgE family stress response membrane protein [Polyangiaceae bacterium]|jgi:uncharacterized membrane protein YeaQ/YmgE (transglycosylase-associated protein family)|nr:GlsB/YeaQ/YmgE family stress response membrane protein [Polyangiaceae bacterium]